MRAILTLWMTLAVSWVTLAATSPGVSGVVLCVGADGQFSVELAHQGRCEGSHDAQDDGGDSVIGALTCEATDCCSDCVDASHPWDNVSQPAPGRKHSRASKSCVTLIPASTWNDRTRDAMGPGTCPVTQGPPLHTPAAILARRIMVLLV